MKYQCLKEYINNQNWTAAKQELEHILSAEHEMDEELAILGATVYLEEGMRKKAYEYICKGLKLNYKNYELYFLLGNYYEYQNINQAWLCYENAEFYCDDADDLEVICGYKKRMQNSEGWNVRNYSIVLLSYNLKGKCQQCISSIRENNSPQSYELVIVDNASTDGITEWLKEQKDIKVICNTENRGFPGGCNQGIKASEPENDILLLNNDTIIYPNSIFWLRMALYETEGIGATGSISNSVGNHQRIEEKFDSMEEYRKYALETNIPMENACEKKMKLIAFAMLIRRKALDEVGMLDERFSPGNFEDDDLGIRLQYAGWKLLLCHNSFIYHYEHGDGRNVNLWGSVMTRNREKFKQKWGFDSWYYMNSRRELISLIKKDKGAEISVLEIGCGMGATLAKIEFLWPKARTAGIELVKNVARIGSNYFDIIQGDIEIMQLPYKMGSFDYIILGDVLEHLYDPEAVLKKILPYLKSDGKFLCSIPNMMHRSVILPLLRGKFQYTEEGILDRNNVRFFTLDSITEMFYRCGMNIEKISMTVEKNVESEEDKEMLEALYKLPHIAEKELFEVYQYIFSAGRREDMGRRG